MLDIDEYQTLAREFAVYPKTGPNLGIDSIRGVVYCSLGMVGEAGEFCDKIKKVLRDDGDEITPERHAALVLELGDVLWYVANAAFELRISMEEVARLNLHKLQSRKERGRLQGSGDER